MKLYLVRKNILYRLGTILKKITHSFKPETTIIPDFSLLITPPKTIMKIQEQPFEDASPTLSY